MDGSEIRSLSEGVNQSGVRAHNERLIMSVIQRHGKLPGTDIAKLTGLSAQTVSNILRKLEDDGFLLRNAPKRGRVGKPSVPMALDPDGALSFGLKIGRRSADFAIMNLHGEVLNQRQMTYRYPMPSEIFGYLAKGIDDFSQALSPKRRGRLCGIGIAIPSDIWNWVEVLGAPSEFRIWNEIDFAREVSRISDLPLFTENDATAACRAEHIFGRGRRFADYAYFFIGSFIGGGVVMKSSVVVGAKNNAGAFGSLRVQLRDGRDSALIDAASLYLLEDAVAASGGDTAAMWRMPQDWTSFGAILDEWIASTSHALALACRSVVAVIDFEAVLIDGALPPEVRARLVAAVRCELDRLDMRGLAMPVLEEGQVGGNARVLGAAAAPIYAQYLFG